MKILVFGRGVIASVYGWVLEQAGHEVEFYVRPGRAAAYGETIDLDLLDTRRRRRGQRVVRKWPVRYREDLDGRFDLVLLSVQHYRVAEAAAVLAPHLGEATVLVFGNLWAEPAAVVGDLPPEQVVWGFPQAGGGFGADGVLRGALLPSFVFGTFDRPPTEREQAVRQAFCRAGLRIKEQADFRGWLLIHFAWNAGLHAQGLKRGSLSELIGRTGDLREALLATRELRPLLEARGVDLRRHRASALSFRVPARPAAAVLGWLIGHVGPLRVNFEAQSDPGAEEPRAICRDTLAEARRRGIAVPRLEAALAHRA
ncbi:2-dehydropantoate 2-reductase N-terminal domain-containing protein [Amycolatopsis sp. PS_44_ISF1]|uniref:ketopantoate reductase family protein n=1 Tax=Amycolatopsis sp. PS_44_ISF1 TaxID=2974917 RepID=UPI0028DFE15E|nr:2-dehydropantoate 2-reductase N-terminal domain-containing protein [Amycolatopsis sp. PS_44_ISF1]MDT8915241.1 ketopantoate reductase [Amycolatopsis sp. PS_44_ISF1]